MTTKEAEDLIKMLKELVAKKVEIPQMGYDKEYEIKGIDNPRFKFIFVINRKTQISEYKCTYTVRDRNTNTNLLRLDIGCPPHKNPDGTKIIGPHLHIYQEEYNHSNNLPYAIEFDINNPSLIKNCVAFLKKFHVIKHPTIFEQSVLFH